MRSVPNQNALSSEGNAVPFERVLDAYELNRKYTDRQRWPALDVRVPGKNDEDPVWNQRERDSDLWNPAAHQIVFTHDELPDGYKTPALLNLNGMNLKHVEFVTRGLTEPALGKKPLYFMGILSPFSGNAGNMLLGVQFTGECVVYNNSDEYIRQATLIECVVPRKRVYTQLPFHELAIMPMLRPARRNSKCIVGMAYADADPGDQFPLLLCPSHQQYAPLMTREDEEEEE